MNIPTVIYHSADFDGIFCREIASKFLGECNLIGWNFGDPLIRMPNCGDVYILDLSPDCIEGDIDSDRIIWIDHHKTSIEKWAGSCFVGCRIDGVAACRLAWQYFSATQPSTLPIKEDYINRTVKEPLSVRLAGEYDVWDKRDPRAEVFQLGLRSRELTSMDWAELLCNEKYDQDMFSTLMDNGEVLQQFMKQSNEKKMEKAFVLKWAGLNFLALNLTSGNSLTFASKDVPETGHDALLSFSYNGSQWTISMYHAKHRTDLDLSELAKSLGGGGHRGACGFTCDILPFEL